MIGVICATDDELDAVCALDPASADPARTRLIAGEAFRTIFADDPERAAVVTRTQIGKVNAALAATLLISHPPLGADILVVIGVGGALNPDLKAGDTIVASHIGCHDYGVIDAAGMTAVTPGAFPLDGPEAVLEPVHTTALRLARDLLAASEVTALGQAPGERLLLGGVLTGDVFITADAARNHLRHRFRADVVDMESHAVFQVARRFGVPVIVLRSVSDSAGEDAGEQYLSTVTSTCDRAASYLPAMLRLIAAARQEGSHDFSSPV